MDRIAVVTDSSCSLSTHEAQNPALTIIEIGVLADEKVIRTRDELLLAFKNSKKVQTASPSPSTFQKAFIELFEAGYTYIFSIHMSAKLSSTYNNAKIASQDFEGKVTVFDSKTAGFAQGKLVLEILSKIHRGASRYEVINRINNFTPDQVILLPQAMESLKQGGRIKAGAAMVAQLFQITPWGKIIDGKLLYAGRAKSFDAALKLIWEKEINQQRFPRSVVVQTQDGRLPDALQQLDQSLPLASREIPKVLLAHTGPGAIALTIER